MKTVPYTTSTGIKIGSRYNESPKPMPIEDEDMLYIQSILICSPKWHRQRNVERWAVLVCTSMALLISVTFWLSAK